jgi:SAM-dependent methyltransferase
MQAAAAAITRGDAFGRALLDWARGFGDPEIIERDDGQIELGAGPDGYLAEFEGWPVAEQQSLAYLRGRVLDVGCGAGRVGQHLQALGHDVVGIDSSRLAVRAARELGLRHAKVSLVDDVVGMLGRFDSILFFGNNLGVFGTPARATRLLKHWSSVARPSTRIFIESTDPLSGGVPVVDRDYARRNRELGRPTGQVRMRIWYDRVSTDWVPWFFAARSELRSIVEGTGWRITIILGTRRNEPYVAILELDA